MAALSLVCWSLRDPVSPQFIMAKSGDLEMLDGSTSGPEPGPGNPNPVRIGICGIQDPANRIPDSRANMTGIARAGTSHRLHQLPRFTTDSGYHCRYLLRRAMR